MSNAATHEPAPVVGGENVAEYVLCDIELGVEMGLTKYGTKLQTHNGRDSLWDAYQEALDLVFYLRQAILEKETTDVQRT